MSAYDDDSFELLYDQDRFQRASHIGRRRFIPSDPQWDRLVSDWRTQQRQCRTCGCLYREFENIGQWSCYQTVFNELYRGGRSMRVASDHLSTDSPLVEYTERDQLILPKIVLPFIDPKPRRESIVRDVLTTRDLPPSSVPSASASSTGPGDRATFVDLIDQHGTRGTNRIYRALRIVRFDYEDARRKLDLKTTTREHVRCGWHSSLNPDAHLAASSRRRCIWDAGRDQHASRYLYRHERGAGIPYLGLDVCGPPGSGQPP